MLNSMQHIRGYTIQATDGNIGKVEYFLFDDTNWKIRYLVVNTGDWLKGRRVLVSPDEFGTIDRVNETFHLNLTRQQVKDSPELAEHQPVSHQQHREYSNYYDYPLYWGAAGMWGPTRYTITPGMQGGFSGAAVHTMPMPEDTPEPPPLLESEDTEEEEEGDPHLRSTHELQSYYVEAHDGEVGHVCDFIGDDENWIIRYMVVDTSEWCPSDMHVLISPDWVEDINWFQVTIQVDLWRDAIRQAPAYHTHKIDRQYEQILHAHYQRPGYWEQEEKPTSAQQSGNGRTAV